MNSDKGACLEQESDWILNFPMMGNVIEAGTYQSMLRSPGIKGSGPGFPKSGPYQLVRHANVLHTTVPCQLAQTHCDH
jgi:hypothetical protein